MTGTITAEEDTDIFSKAMGGLSNLFNEYVTEPVSNTTEAAVDFVGSIPGRLSNAFNDYVVQPVVNLASNIGSGISHFFNHTAAGLVEGAWDATLRAVGSMLGGEDSTLGGWFYEVAARDTFISPEEEVTTAAPDPEVTVGAPVNMVRPAFQPS